MIIVFLRNTARFVIDWKKILHTLQSLEQFKTGRNTEINLLRQLKLRLLKRKKSDVVFLYNAKRKKTKIKTKERKLIK